MEEAITRLVFQLAAILVVAKLAGEGFERFLKMPAVLGELAAGILIGPFALGAVDVPALGPLFEHLPEAIGGEEAAVPVSEGLWGWPR